MDLDKFTKLSVASTTSLEDLTTMLQNALRKGAREHAAIAKNALDRRFPGWNVAKSKRGGSKPTVAKFFGSQQQFATSKEAYIWLVERFIAQNPKAFAAPSSGILDVALGKRRNYFGRNLKRMFHASPELAENPSNYVRLSNGWYANVNLNNAEKFRILLGLAAVTRVAYPNQWDWVVLDPTDALLDKKAATALGERLLAELESLADDGDQAR